MELSNSVLIAHRELYNQWTEIEEKLRKGENEAKQANAETEVTLMRDGNEVKIKEKYLWIEARAGVEESLQFILNKYPYLKDLEAERKAKVDEIEKFELVNFGFTYKQMTFPNVISLIQGIIRLENELG